METETLQRSSQFRIVDFLLLTAGCAYALAVLVPVAARQPYHAFVLIAITTGLTLAGSLISYPIWRFLLQNRLTVLVVNHLGYLLPWAVLGIVWDDEAFRIIPALLKGPFSYFGRTLSVGGTFPRVDQSMVGILIIAFLAAPMVLLMCAHPLRPNLIGVILTSLGIALWYVTAFVALLAQMP